MRSEQRKRRVHYSAVYDHNSQQRLLWQAGLETRVTLSTAVGWPRALSKYAVSLSVVFVVLCALL